MDKEIIYRISPLFPFENPQSLLVQSTSSNYYCSGESSLRSLSRIFSKQNKKQKTKRKVQRANLTWDTLFVKSPILREESTTLEQWPTQGGGPRPMEPNPCRQRCLKDPTAVNTLSQLSSLFLVVKDTPFQPNNWHSLSLLVAEAISQRETEQEAAGTSACVSLSRLWTPEHFLQMLPADTL